MCPPDLFNDIRWPRSKRQRSRTKDLTAAVTARTWMAAQARWMMRYNVFRLTENGAGDVSGDEEMIDMRGTNSKTCITRRLVMNVFGEVNGLNTTVARDTRTLTTNLTLTIVFLRDKLRLKRYNIEHVWAYMYLSRSRRMLKIYKSKISSCRIELNWMKGQEIWFYPRGILCKYDRVAESARHLIRAARKRFELGTK